MTKLKIFAQSRKAWVMTMGILVIVFRDGLGLTEETAMYAAGIAASYILGQGMADFGQDKN